MDEPRRPHAEIPSEEVRRRCATLIRAGGFPVTERHVGTGQAGTARTGDLIRIQLWVPRGRVVEGARFKAFGCASSIAAASLAAEWAEGRTLEEVLAIRGADLAADLDLPASKLQCSRLAEEALREAVADCRRRRKSFPTEPADLAGPRSPKRGPDRLRPAEAFHTIQEAVNDPVD